jgi:hypothetical protein
MRKELQWLTRGEKIDIVVEKMTQKVGRKISCGGTGEI